MTSFAFILGVAPLVVSTGAGGEMRQSLGTAVFGGMLGVTAFGLLFTPVFYVVVRRFWPHKEGSRSHSCTPLRKSPATPADLCRSAGRFSIRPRGERR